jgi:hypothetical protein
MIRHQLLGRVTKWLLLAAALAIPAVVIAEEESASTSPNTGLGIAPEQVSVAGATNGEAPPLTIRIGNEWKFGFHGYFRAPMRMSFDHEKVTQYQTDADGRAKFDANGNVLTKEIKDWRISTGPQVPDNAYINWKNTNNLGGSWGELNFSYGNEIAVANIQLASYTIQNGAWRLLQSQLGINQAYVALNFPRAFGARGGLFWNVGMFDNRYGGAGRYDAGRYDTYIFGRTHQAGETLTAKLDLTDHLLLILEHGFGAKSDVLPGTPKQRWDPANEGNTFAWIPYSGMWGQVPAMIHHAHAGVMFHTFPMFRELFINLHFMHAFTKSEDQDDSDKLVSSTPYHLSEGKKIVFGGEVKANGGIFGDTYLGYSFIQTDGLIRMPDILEQIHSIEGWNILKNYYGDMNLVDDNSRPEGRNADPNPGTGIIHTLAWQYMFSVSRVLYYLQGKEFWGQGPDLQFSTWGMFNIVNPDKELRPYLKRWAEKKLKVGGEVMYIPLQYLGVGFRIDRVIPDLDYDIDDRDYNLASVQSFAPFTVLTPKILFRTAFITHEEVNISYCRYLWKGERDEVRAESPYERDNAHRNAFQLSVNIWW